MNRFTDLAVSRLTLPAQDRKYVFARGDVQGLALRLSASGRRSWVLMYWAAENGTVRQRRLILGEFPQMPVADARKAAADRLAAIKGDSADPAADRAAERRDTFLTLAEHFLERPLRKRSGEPVRPATLVEYRRALMVYAKPLHQLPVRRIRKAQIVDVLDAAERAGPVNRERVRAALSRFWSWLIARDRADANPVLATEARACPKRQRLLTTTELAAIWRACAGDHDHDRAVRLCALTGQRRGEVGGMCWSEVDLARAVWTIPASRYKGRRAHAVPLPRQAVEIIAAVPRIVGQDALFGRGDGGFSGWSACKRRLDAKVGAAVEPWSLHDIRRAVRSGLSALGVSAEIAERVLGHALPGLQAVYDVHDYEPQKRAALQRWADHLDRLVAGRAAENVRELARA